MENEGLKQLAIVDYTPVKEEANFSFFTNKGNHMNLRLQRSTFELIMGLKKWDKDKLGEITKYQRELVEVVKKEIKSDFMDWFDKEARTIMKAKTTGTHE